MDRQAGDRILKLHHSIEVRQGDGDPHGVLPGLYFLLAAEYAEAGQLGEAARYLDMAEPAAKTAEQRRACRELRRQIIDAAAR